MKRFAAIPLAALVALALAQDVGASQPVREGLPASPFTLDASICGFAIDVTFPTNKEFGITFSNGKEIITGSLFITLTNDQSHQAITLNISGPGTIVTANGITTEVLSGRSLLFFFPGQLGPGAPGLLILTSGPAKLVSDSNGNILSFDRTSASVEDLCPLL